MGTDTIFWIIAVVLFGVAEAATTALISIWFMVGAAVALVVSLFTASIGIQFLVFAVVSAITLGIMVPLLARRNLGKKAPVTNGAPLTIGKRGEVLKALTPGGIGRVRVDGLDWQARADTSLPAGAHCTVTGVEGAVLLVTAVPAEEEAAAAARS